MKRSVAWSKKGSRAVVVVPKTRAKTTTILGAISPYGVVNIKHEQLKGNYIVMDNADIRKYIEQRGYGCVYLPAYSPELNPIEQFWKRQCRLELEMHATRSF
ncbi:hypothetical protein G6F62_013496 [Rhizopus arrhizus]|nr:hypothetical protein G6F62_013496 [Rhizopus arrhizus]